MLLYNYLGLTLTDLVHSASFPIIIRTISLQSIADGRFSSAIAVVIPGDIMFQGTLKFSCQTLKLTVILDVLLLDIEVLSDSEDGSSVAVLRTMSEWSTGVSVTYAI